MENFAGLSSTHPYLSPSLSLLNTFAMDCLQQRIAAVVVDIVNLAGSAPRGTGTTMLITQSSLSGTVGGGNLEFHAINRAREFLGFGSQTLAADEVEELVLGPSLGQCCGGRVKIRYAWLSQPVWQARLDQMRHASRFRLQLFGAGHVGAALVRALAPLPCEIRWVDERADITRELPELGQLIEDLKNRSGFEWLCVDTPAAEVSSAKPGDFYLVMTHSHAQDQEIIEAILKRGDAGYVGLIGSATKAAMFASRLKAKNLAQDTLHCPVGLPGLKGKEPEVIAASIVSDLLLRS